MNKSINETLNVIRQALQEENITDEKNNVLILDQLVNDDGTITELNNNNISKNEIRNILSNEISEIFDNHFDKWLDKNLPKYIEKHFSKKEK